MSFLENYLIVDEIQPSEIERLCDLLNAIFAEFVAIEVSKLREQLCCGCQIEHPSQRRHSCFMLSVEEGWETYGLQAVERILEKELIWTLFKEAVRVMKIPCYFKPVADHLTDLLKNREKTVDFLNDLSHSTRLSDYKDILGYLYYWNKEQ